MDKEQVIAELNHILSLEYTAVLQYTHESLVVDGLERTYYVEMFRREAAEALAHAHLIGEKIVALGGMPTTEVGEIAPATDLHEMLRINLRLESAAVEAYSRALAVAQDDVALRTLLEGQIMAEQASVDELQRILKGVEEGGAEPRASEVPEPARARRVRGRRA